MVRFLSDLAGTMRSTFKIGKVYAAPTLDCEAAPKKYVDDKFKTVEYLIRLGYDAVTPTNTVTAKIANAPAGGIPDGWLLLQGVVSGDARISTDLGTMATTDLILIHNVGKTLIDASIVYRTAPARIAWNIGAPSAGTFKTNRDLTQIRVSAYNTIVGDTDSILYLKMG
jgi:hypothetical protein